MVFNATFNNISFILLRSVLLVEETEVPGENHRPATGSWQTLSHNVVSSTPRLSGIWTHNVSYYQRTIAWWLIIMCITGPTRPVLLVHSMSWI